MPSLHLKKVESNFSHSFMIACATVMEEALPLLPAQMQHQVLDFGLHVNPGQLKLSLQNAINVVPANIKRIVLGYGLCSQAVVGLKSDKSTLVVPRIDDCIGIFLGSKSAYSREQKAVPGTYYLTKGWIKTASTPFDEFDDLVKRYGLDKARRIMQKMLNNYTRLAFINTGQTDLADYHAKTRNLAAKFGLQYAEIQGSDALVSKMIFGPWDDDFIVVKPGETITFDQAFG